jgi:hypothetical protein
VARGTQEKSKTRVKREIMPVAQPAFFSKKNVADNKSEASEALAEQNTPDKTDLIELEHIVDGIKSGFEKIILGDDEILLLACREIANTYTRDEKNYK